MPPQKFYRYVWVQSGHKITHVELYLEVFTLVKETPKGYWITRPFFFKKRWVSKTSRKRYAYPTKEEALINFQKRTEIRIDILETQLAGCKRALALSREADIDKHTQRMYL